MTKYWRSLYTPRGYYRYNRSQASPPYLSLPKDTFPSSCTLRPAYIDPSLLCFRSSHTCTLYPRILHLHRIVPYTTPSPFFTPQFIHVPRKQPILYLSLNVLSLNPQLLYSPHQQSDFPITIYRKFDHILNLDTNYLYLNRSMSFKVVSYSYPQRTL